MSNSPFELEDRAQKTDLKFCPLVKATCVGSACQWWVMDFHEEKEAYRMNCAVTLIAQGINDESLHRVAGR